MSHNPVRNVPYVNLSRRIMVPAQRVLADLNPVRSVKAAISEDVT